MVVYAMCVAATFLALEQNFMILHVFIHILTIYRAIHPNRLISWNRNYLLFIIRSCWIKWMVPKNGFYDSKQCKT